MKTNNNCIIGKRTLTLFGSLAAVLGTAYLALLYVTPASNHPAWSAGTNPKDGGNLERGILQVTMADGRQAEIYYVQSSLNTNEVVFEQTGNRVIARAVPKKSTVK